MAELQLLIIGLIGMFIGFVVSYIIFKVRKKEKREEHHGDIYIIKDDEEGVQTYVSWETEPENYINKDRVILKVKTK